MEDPRLRYYRDLIHKAEEAIRELIRSGAADQRTVEVVPELTLAKPSEITSRIQFRG